MSQINNTETLKLIEKNPSQIRKAIENKNTSICAQKFWERKFGINVRQKFAIAHEYTKESRLRLLHFKICHNIYPTNILLNRMRITSSELCTFCKVPDYIEHFFIQCQKLDGFWEKIFQTINSYSTVRFTMSIEKILFGITKMEEPNANVKELKMANNIILIGKMSISKMKYGLLKNIHLIFEREWALRKNKVID